MISLKHSLVRLTAGAFVLYSSGCSSTERSTTTIGSTSPAVNRRVERTPGSRLSVSPETYLSHIALLAHDDLGGRGTGQDGIDLAGGYIAGQFASIGLKPGGPKGTYFQAFEVDRPAEILSDTKMILSGCDATPVLREDFMPFNFSSTGSFSGEVVFVGYGIVNPEKSHDDYAGVDVQNRVVLMLRRAPTSWADADLGDHPQFETKVKLAKAKGAAAVVVVNQVPEADGMDTLMRMRRRGDDCGLPAMHIKRDLCDKMLKAAGAPSITDLQKALDTLGANVSAPLVNIRAEGAVAFSEGKMPARNVIATLPGNGPNADEYVVIGAHYDHLGLRRGSIYNGADDNASGTAGVIEIARMMAQTPRRNRSLIFMTFSGEEIGLLGSRHFVEEPTVPIDQIAAMLNMDMIGRLTPDKEEYKLAIQGLGTGESFQRIVERRAKEAGLEFVPDPSAKGPSDHASFEEKGIPSLFFFTGVHEDYHQPGDDTEKINVPGAIQIVELVHRIALDLVNEETAPQFVVIDQPARIFRGAAGPSRGPVMGIMPDFEDNSDAPGWRVAMVSPEGGAAKAGMKSGDRILKINGVSINDFSDYRKATADKKAGDTVPVILLREGQEVTLEVELSARGG